MDMADKVSSTNRANAVVHAVKSCYLRHYMYVAYCANCI